MVAIVDVLETVVLAGTLGIIAAGLLGIIAQVFLSYLSGRNLTDIHSMGIQAVISQNQQDELAKDLDE